MNKFQKMWKEKSKDAKSNNFGDAVPIEPGKYNFQITNSKIAKDMLIVNVVPVDYDVDPLECTLFFKFDEESFEWIQKALLSFGVDIDDYSPESEEDVNDIFLELVHQKACCRGACVKKAGYKNIYLNAPVEVEDELLIEPNDTTERPKPVNIKSKSKMEVTKQTEVVVKTENLVPPNHQLEDSEEEFEIEIGSIVSFKHKEGMKTGPITRFDNEDDPNYAFIKHTADKRATKVELSLLLPPVTPDTISDSANTNPSDLPNFEIDDHVECDFGDDEFEKGIIVSLPPDGSGALVQFGENDSEMVPWDKMKKLSNGMVPTNELFSLNDKVEWVQRGRTRKGEIVGKGSNENTFTVRDNSTSQTLEKTIEQLSYQSN